MDSYRCARLNNRFSCKCATSFVRLLSNKFRNFIRKMSDIMNSTFYLSEQRFTFEDYLEQQSFDDETPTNSTYNQFNGPLTFEVYLHSCSALDSFNSSPCTTDSSDNSSFSLYKRLTLPFHFQSIFKIQWQPGFIYAMTILLSFIFATRKIIFTFTALAHIASKSCLIYWRG